MNLGIKERLDEALEKYGLSQAQAAREMNYSPGVLSSYRKDDYKGDVQKLEGAIVQWLARQAKARERKCVPIVDTDDLRKITNAIQIAHTEKDIALIIADAGAGKSTAASWYAKYNEKATVLIDVMSGMNRRMLVHEIARQLSIEIMRVPFNTVVKNVTNMLYERDMVVILDEADYLRPDALEFTRRLVHDLGQSGLVLIGLPRLKYQIQNLRNDHRQLESRIGVCLHLSGLSRADAALIAESVWPNINKKIVDAIYHVSKSDVRQFTKIIERMQQTMAINNVSEPDVDIVETAAALIMRRGGQAV
ncbi:MAG: AAA family ATPase [Treponema sp.]|jgi:DNA transposition AAA+ family ATPase|nr:AAA family ATPase [Treponema sp.]